MFRGDLLRALAEDAGGRGGGGSRINTGAFGGATDVAGQSPPRARSGGPGAARASVRSLSMSPGRVTGGRLASIRRRSEVCNVTHQPLIWDRSPEHCRRPGA